ncbi:phosphatase, partial [Streptomyces sp. SID6013]|nr:phosphatase [Streptomyces sp. SID6013]
EQRTSTTALVATELATNLLKHAGGGQVLIDVVAPPVLAAGREATWRVQIVTVDHGPGISDVSAALRDGFTTTGSLGAGLGTCARLADDFDLHSVPGRGTVVVARVGAVPEVRAADTGPAGRLRAGAVNVPFGGA